MWYTLLPGELLGVFIHAKHKAIVFSERRMPEQLRQYNETNIRTQGTSLKNMTNNQMPNLNDLRLYKNMGATANSVSKKTYGVKNV